MTLFQPVADVTLACIYITSSNVEETLLEAEMESLRLAAAAATSEQVLELVRNGITCFHFYTLNRADLVFAICHLLGLRPTSSLRAIDV